MRFLIFGDVVAKIGRRSLKKQLPELKEKYKPDFTIVNAENLAHGKGITEKTINEMKEAGVDFFTGGNHIFAKEPGLALLEENYVIRPANYSSDKPGVGYQVVEVAKNPILVLNLQGKEFMTDKVGNPFLTFDQIIGDPKHKDIRIILVDFHGEVTSERIAFGWHSDGRCSLVWGTHTHVQTNDDRILPKGTGYITDIGMTGALNGVIGVKREVILNNFISPIRKPHDFDEAGEAQISGIVADIDETTGKCINIEKIRIEITI